MNITINTIEKIVYILHSPTCKIVMETHISRISFAIEGSRTGGKSTSVISLLVKPKLDNISKSVYVSTPLI